MNPTEILETARKTLEIEIESIALTSTSLDDGFLKAVHLISQSQGKVVVTGMGKSGHIGHKISATLASTGTPSFFMHPAEAYHGDLGMIDRHDTVLAISYSGETDEILKLIPYLKSNGNKLISLSGRSDSTLARNSDAHIQISITREACPLELAPTSSTTVSLAIGDALAVCLMKIKGFKAENFARYHPGGSLGRRLLSKVRDHMRTDNLPIVSYNSTLTQVINVMSAGRLGLALVAANANVQGIITDGDLRRLLERKGKNAFDLKAGTIMTPNPKTILPTASLKEAEQKMLDNKINSLVVVDDLTGDLLGVIQIYDIQ